jgi:DUF4097 and DUF4098 domain-containing protein YvlB
MSQNRKISQFASYVAYDNSATNIAITTTTGSPNVGIGSTIPEQKLTVAGNIAVNGNYYNSNGICVDDLYELDDISSAVNVDGVSNTFTPSFNYTPVSIPTPFKLLITVNGVLQSAYVYNSEYVWQSNLLCANDGYTLDQDGNIKFTEALPMNTQVVIKTASGGIKSIARKYPFKPLDLAY